MITFDVAGEAVFLCVVDYAFSIKLEKGLNLRLEADFDYLDSAGTLHRITPEDDPTSCGPALGVSRATVASMHTTSDGHLEMTFTDGSRLSVEATPAYEAWATTESNGAKVVCLPDGELAIWGPLDQPSISQEP